jgi:transcriptional regulator with XRE-family HTH domain
MGEISKHVGEKIRLYRTVRGLTIQELSDRISKCKTTVSKYERGDITVDVETLVEIARVLNIPVEQFMDFPIVEESLSNKEIPTGLFYNAHKMYMYFYDGRVRNINCSVLEIKDTSSDGKTILYSNAESDDNYHNCKAFYSGKVNYYDPFIRISVFNQCNSMEQLLIYVINPMDISKATLGLMCGISNKPLLPSATKCIISTEPLKKDDELADRLKFSKDELHSFKKLNLLIVDYDK